MTPKIPKKPQLTEDEICRRAYILLLIKVLKHCKVYNLASSSLTTQDKAVIEYHLRNVAMHAVLEDTSQDECVAIFEGRISRLITANNEEWLRVNDLLNRNELLLTTEEKNEFATLFTYFRGEKKKTHA